MNPRQRRGVLLMILAALGAVAVFVSVLSYVGQVNEKVGNMRPVLQVTQDVPTNKKITADMVKKVQVPAKWTSDTALESVGQVQGMVAATDLPAGVRMQKGMVQQAPALEPGNREIAIMVDAETGVAGNVQPGEVVDVYATIAANEDTANCAIRVLSSVPVLQVGSARVQESSGATSGATQASAPVTFSLSPQQSLELTYIEAFAETIRLARIGGAGKQGTPPDDAVCKVPRTGDDSTEAAAPAGGGGGGGGGGQR